MDSDCLDLKIGIDHCLDLLQSLDKLSIQTDHLCFKGSKVNLSQNFSAVMSILVDLVKEKDNLTGTLRTASDTLLTLARRTETHHVLDSFGSPEVKPPPVNFGPLMNKLTHTMPSVLSTHASGLEPLAAGSTTHSMTGGGPTPQSTISRSMNDNDRLIYEHERAKAAKTKGADAKESDLKAGAAKTPGETRDTNTMTQSFHADPVKSSDAEKMKIQIDALKKEIKDLKQKQEEDKRTKLAEPASPEDLKQDFVVRKLMEQNADLEKRLAAQTKAKPQEPSGEKDDSRRTYIADEYKALMSNGWQEAKVVLDKESPEEQYDKIKHIFLTGVLKHAERKASDFYNDLVDGMATKMKNPFTRKTTEETIVKPKRPKSIRRKGNPTDEDRYALPSNVLRGVNDFLVQKSEDVNMAPLVEAVKNSLLDSYAKDKEKTNETLTEPAMHAYMEGCARLAWRMVVHQPALTFDVRAIGKAFDSTKLELAPGGKGGEKNALVTYYKYPSLMCGSECLVKGVVYVE